MSIAWLVLAIVVLDQGIKYFVQQTMFLGMSLPIIPDLFHITYILNPGAAFGILANQRIFFIVTALGMMMAILYFYPKIRQMHWLLRTGVGLLCGGAVGNVVDRVRMGSVVDFLDFRVWPIFNIADIAIVIGVSMVFYAMLFLHTSRDDQNEY